MLSDLINKFDRLDKEEQEAGKQVLSGSETVKFLRFRQNNDGTIKEGDIQRIPRQQQFVLATVCRSH